MLIPVNTYVDGLLRATTSTHILLNCLCSAVYAIKMTFRSLNKPAAIRLVLARAPARPALKDRGDARRNDSLLLDLLAWSEVLAGKARLRLRSVQQVVVCFLAVGGICSVYNYFKCPCHNSRSVANQRKVDQNFETFEHRIGEQPLRDITYPSAPGPLLFSFDAVAKVLRAFRAFCCVAVDGLNFIFEVLSDWGSWVFLDRGIYCCCVVL